VAVSARVLHGFELLSEPIGLAIGVVNLKTESRCAGLHVDLRMSVCPKHACGGIKAMLHKGFDQIDTDAVHAQYGKSAA
jgi:hypothetical protein